MISTFHKLYLGGNQGGDPQLYFRLSSLFRQVRSNQTTLCGDRAPLGAVRPPGVIHTEDKHMRLAGIEKGGFYPYPPHIAEATASWFIPLPAGTRGRLLDPCAGEGEIASILGKLLNCETWGCELFPYRAEKAAARIDKCHSAAWEGCSLTDESVTLLWLNPPYDDDRHGDDKRLELAFLKSTTPKLVAMGTVIEPVPVTGLAARDHPCRKPTVRCLSAGIPVQAAQLPPPPGRSAAWTFNSTFEILLFTVFGLGFNREAISGVMHVTMPNTLVACLNTLDFDTNFIKLLLATISIHIVHQLVLAFPSNFPYGPGIGKTSKKTVYSHTRLISLFVIST